MLRARLRHHATALAVPAIAAAVSAVQVVSQFREDFGVTQGRRIGTTLRTDGEVLKRSAHSFRWFNVASSEDLVEKTSLKTSENSEVSLKFQDGSTLELGPHALVVLGSASEGVPRLKVVRGGVKFKSKSKMVIEANGKTLESAAASGRVDVTNGSATTSLSEGTGTLISAEAKPLPMAAGSVASVAIDGLLTAKNTPNAATPKQATRSGDFEVFPYEVKGGKKLSTRLTASQSTKVLRIELSWKPVEGASEYVVDFFDAQKKRTSRRVTATPTLGLELRKTAEFDRFYRITAKKGDHEFRSEMLRYSIELAAPRLVNPAPNTQWKGGIATWESTILTDNYEVQFARSPAFEKPTVVDSPGNFANVRLPENGTYYWRVRANVGGRWSPWSDVQKFKRE